MYRISKPCGKSDPMGWEKYRKCKYSKAKHLSGEAEIHKIAKAWENWIQIVREKYGKARTFQS